MTNPFYTFMFNTEKDTFIIQLTDEKYKNVVAKVGHLEYNQDEELEFDMELPESQKEYYDDTHFIEMIQNAVYDIVAKSIRTYWNDAEQSILNDLESKLSAILDAYNIDKHNKSYLEMFAEKMYLITEDDDDKLVAVNSEGKKYFFDDKNDFAFLRGEIGGSMLIV